MTESVFFFPFNFWTAALKPAQRRECGDLRKMSPFAFCCTAACVVAADLHGNLQSEGQWKPSYRLHSCLVDSRWTRWRTSELGTSVCWIERRTVKRCIGGSRHATPLILNSGLAGGYSLALRSCHCIPPCKNLPRDVPFQPKSAWVWPPVWFLWRRRRRRRWWWWWSGISQDLSCICSPHPRNPNNQIFYALHRLLQKTKVIHYTGESGLRGPDFKTRSKCDCVNPVSPRVDFNGFTIVCTTGLVV